MIQTSTTRSRHGSRTAPSVSVLLVAAWGIGWIAFHASRDAYAHTLFQTFALAESVIALLMLRRKPIPGLLGILLAYLAFQLDPLLLPALLTGLFTVATLAERRAVLLATAATTTAVAALPLTGRASFDLPGYLLPRLLAVATAAAIGLWAQTRARTETS
jgi:hypothetical protein